MTLENSNIIQALNDIGMSERESKVYFALLNKSNASVTDLQRISGVPQNKIYLVLDSLVKRGYCLERKEGRRRRYEIIDPQIGLSSAFTKLEDKLSKLNGIKQEINDLYRKADILSSPLEYFEVIHGNDNIHHHYLELVNKTNEELLGFGRRPYAYNTDEGMAEQDQAEHGILERGGIQRWIYEINLPDDINIIDDLQNLQRSGGHFHIAASLPLKMMIFDRKTLFIAEEEPLSKRGELYMSVIKQQIIVDAFRALFEFFWNNSVELNEWIKNYSEESVL
ncbi:MAG: helix-turn-helix domain-containing protein [bacterium]